MNEARVAAIRDGDEQSLLHKQSDLGSREVYTGTAPVPENLDPSTKTHVFELFVNGVTTGQKKKVIVLSHPEVQALIAKILELEEYLLWHKYGEPYVPDAIDIDENVLYVILDRILQLEKSIEYTTGPVPVDLSTVTYASMMARLTAVEDAVTWKEVTP